MSRVREVISQAAALPVKNGKVCLVLSGGGKWILPKGHIECAETAGQAAVREAWEEAGVTGRVGKTPVGTYRYEKSGRAYVVTVFVMRVRSVSHEWPEAARRVRRWVVPSEAHRVLGVRPLRKLVRRVIQSELIESA